MLEASTSPPSTAAPPSTEALGTAVLVGRFVETDLASLLASILDDQRTERNGTSENHSLQPGTSAWKALNCY